MKIRLTLLAVITALFFVGCSGNSGVAGGDAIEFSFNPKPGDNYTMKMQMEVDVDAMGQKMFTEFYIDGDWDIIDKTNDSLFNTSMGFNRMRMKMASPLIEEPIIIDTDMPDTSMSEEMHETLKMISYIKDVRVFLTMGPQGDYADFRMEADSLPPDIYNQLQSSFKQSLVENFKIYPDHPVKVGESWETNVDKKLQALNITIKAKHTHTLSQITDDKIILNLKTDFSSEENELNMTGSGNGEYSLNRESGMIEEAVVDITLEMDMGIGTAQIKVTTSIKTEKQ